MDKFPPYIRSLPKRHQPVSKPNYTKGDLEFFPSLNEFRSLRENSPLTVFAGANNSGKSLVLKWLKYTIGRSAYLIGVNRFYHVYHFTPSVSDPHEVDSFENQFNSQFQQEQFNHEQNYFDLNRIIIGLSNQKRKTLFDLCGELLGNTFSLRKVDPNNDLSVSYIDMDGQNLSVGSSGTRLLMTILGICMNDRFSTILIDEPELGLGPKVQQSFAKFLQDSSERKRYFAHLQQVFLATHSHIFLDRQDIGNNFVVSKADKLIHINQIDSINEFHRLQFNLLGNSLEMMYFPSAIIVVEGPSDFDYIQRIIQLHFPDKKMTVIPSGGDVKKKVHGLKETFGDLFTSPYSSRIFVVIDQVNQKGLTDILVKLGVKQQNIIEWDRNGIEYVYPTSIMTSLFACTPDEINNLLIHGDRIELKGVIKSKTELAKEIISRLDSTTVLPQELEVKLLSRIREELRD